MLKRNERERQRERETERDRETEKEREKKCVCLRERETKGDRERDRKRDYAWTFIDSPRETHLSPDINPATRTTTLSCPYILNMG